MDISGLLGTFAESLSFYIEDFDRIFIHVSQNLPVVGNQVESYVTDTRSLIESKPEQYGSFEGILEDMSQVRIPIFEIIIELQKQDIINQELNHLFDAVKDVQEIIHVHESLLLDYQKNKNMEDLKEDYRNLFTLIGFLLNNMEKQMSRINSDMTDLVDLMEQRFSDLHTKIRSLYNDKKIFSKGDEQENPAIKSLVNVTENLSNELEQYGNFFKRLRLLQDDLNKELEICINLKKEIDEYQKELGGPLSLKECRFTSTVIQKIVNKLSVEEERQTLREEYSELHIEESFTRDVVLF